jgi:hypothetical protein
MNVRIILVNQQPYAQTQLELTNVDVRQEQWLTLMENANRQTSA